MYIFRTSVWGEVVCWCLFGLHLYIYKQTYTALPRPHKIYTLYTTTYTCLLYHLHRYIINVCTLLRPHLLLPITPSSLEGLNLEVCCIQFFIIFDGFGVLYVSSHAQKLSWLPLVTKRNEYNDDLAVQLMML